MQYTLLVTKRDFNVTFFRNSDSGLYGVLDNAFMLNVTFFRNSDSGLYGVLDNAFMLL